MLGSVIGRIKWRDIGDAPKSGALPKFEIRICVKILTQSQFLTILLILFLYNPAKCQLELTVLDVRDIPSRDRGAPPIIQIRVQIGSKNNFLFASFSICICLGITSVIPNHLFISFTYPRPPLENKSSACRPANFQRSFPGTSRHPQRHR